MASSDPAALGLTAALITYVRILYSVHLYLVSTELTTSSIRTVTHPGRTCKDDIPVNTWLTLRLVLTFSHSSIEAFSLSMALLRPFTLLPEDA